MSKIRKIFIHISLTGIIFLILVASLDNKSSMIITMHTKSGSPVESEFYYTTVGKPFSDTKMSRRYKIHDDQYFFRMPDFNQINFARLDPAKHKEDITINDIQIITSNWFRTTVYTADIKKSEPEQQIENYIIENDGVRFKTTGRDPHLNINLTRTLLYTSHNYHLDTFLMALLIYLVLLYLYQLYLKKEFTDDLISKLILYSIFVALAIFKVDYYKEHVHYNYPPDTIAHMSYIESLHTNPEIFPKFENMYMITNKNAGNYLGHPPLYYYIMNLVYDKHTSIGGNVEHFRTLNTVLFLMGILLLFYLSFNIKMSLLSHFTYLTIITSIPMHAYLGSSISNDNLAILGGIIFIVGLQRLLEKCYDNTTYGIVGLGIFISFFGKLTAAILIFFSVLFFLLYLLKKKTLLSISKAQIGILSFFIIPILIYQSYILMHYHTLIPTLNATHPEEYKHSVYFIPEMQRHYQTIIEWIETYWSNIHSGWFGIHSHHSLVKSSILDYIGLLFLHLFAIIALFLPCKEKSSAYCILGKITLLSFFAVMLVQFTFSYVSHLHSGYTGGLQPRYLLPFMASFAIMTSLFVNRFRKHYIFNIFIIVLCIQALYSDFFYFLKYYI